MIPSILRVESALNFFYECSFDSENQNTMLGHTSVTDRRSTLAPSLCNHADMPTAVKLFQYLPQHIPERLVNVCVALLKAHEGLQPLEDCTTHPSRI